MLEVDLLRKRLGPTLALDDCSLRIERGERVVLYGPNGAGKSTLLRIVSGVLVPDAGSVQWRGKSLSSGSAKVRRKLGYVPEAADPPGHLSVAELLQFVASAKVCHPLEESLLERLRLTELMSAPIEELSLGQRRRACLAAALTGDPELLVLDEPTNGLDTDSIAILSALLTESSDRTLLLATHDQDFAAAVQTRRIHIRAGKIVPPTAKDLAETQNDQPED